MAPMNDQIATTTAELPKLWPKWVLIAAGVIGVALAVWLQLDASNKVVTTQTVVDGGTTTQTVDGSLPPAAFISALLGAGVILIVAGSFYDRIKKIDVTGLGSVELADIAAAKAKAEELAPNDPAKATDILRSAVAMQSLDRAAGTAPLPIPGQSRLLDSLSSAAGASHLVEYVVKAAKAIG